MKTIVIHNIDKGCELDVRLVLLVLLDKKKTNK